MKTIRFLSYFFITFFLCTSCHKKAVHSPALSLEDCPVIAHEHTVHEHNILTVDLSLVRDTFIIPFHALLSTFEVIPLDNRDEALVGDDNKIAISDNYIGIYTYQGNGYKLFTRKGEYIKTIARQGNGPNEYILGIYTSHIDEKNNKIYLLPIRSDKILVFDLKGEPQEPIPLSYIVHKGNFRIDPDKQEILMMVLPFEENPSVIWKQDFQGNVLQEIPSAHFKIIPSDYSNEVEASFNTPALDFSLFRWVPEADTLYHYNEMENKLIPVMNLHFRENEEVLRHDYAELPHHYLIRLIVPSSIENVPFSPQVLIDKKTHKGCYVQFRLNSLGNIPGPNYYPFRDGYFVSLIYSHQLMEQLETTLARPEKLTPEMKERIKRLYDSMTEDDNSYLLLGKLK